MIMLISSSGDTMAPRDAVAWDFDAIMPALRDPDRRIPLLEEVDTIVEVVARGQIEKAWTQIADALHLMARTQLQRTTSTVPAAIKDATVRRREALRHRHSCREASAETNHTDSLLALAWTTWIDCSTQTATCDQACSSIGTCRSSITTGPTML